MRGSLAYIHNSDRWYSIRMLRVEWTCILTCKRLFDRAPVCMWGEGFYFWFSSTPLYESIMVHFIIFKLGQVIPAWFFSYHFCLCVCLSVCVAVCVAWLFAMILCRMARQRLTWRGWMVKRRHSLCSRNRLRRSGWTHHRNILVHPDLSSTRIMNILYHT